MGKPTDLIQGTLDLLILKTIALEPAHGWAIAERIRQVSNEVLLVQQGSLYPALHRLEQQGWIKAEWGESEANRRAKYYSLTAAGRKQLSKGTGELGAAVQCGRPGGSHGVGDAMRFWTRTKLRLASLLSGPEWRPISTMNSASTWIAKSNATSREA